jgi:hypothetical protein
MCLSLNWNDYICWVSKHVQPNLRVMFMFDGDLEEICEAVGLSVGGSGISFLCGGDNSG